MSDNFFPQNPKPVEPSVRIGGSEPLADWRGRYVTLEQFKRVKPPTFLIQNFLEDGSITAIGAPVAQRKSIVVANVIHSLLTGEPLFGHFEVVKQPERIIYLCPEMGLVDIAHRFKCLGLEEYVGTRLFIHSMDEPKLKLTDLDGELPNSLLILDTITRFVEGNQNDAGDMAKFADINYAIKRKGATIMLLHHAVKGAGDQGMTLDNALRGSTELAAFVTCVWSTRLEDSDPDASHTTPSNLKCVKQRGFVSKQFQVSCDNKFMMRYTGEATAVIADTDRRAEEAIAKILAANPDTGINKICDILRDMGIKKGAKAVTKIKATVLGTGVAASQG